MKKIALTTTTIVTLLIPLFAFTAELKVTPKTVFRHQTFHVSANGLGAGNSVRVRVSTQDESGTTWTSDAQFKSDRWGKLNVPQPMDLITSLAPVNSSDPTGAYFYFPKNQKVIVTLEDVNGQALDRSELLVKSYDDTKIAHRFISNPQLVGNYYKPKASRKKLPAVLVLSGSDGGTAISDIWAASYSTQGFVSLGLAYFGASSLPKNLNKIPLEYFASAINWLKQQPEVDPKKIFVSGLSKGGELALLLASTYPQDIKGVVAYTPSAYVWQGITPTFTPPESSWTLNGQQLSFVPYRIQPNDFAGFPFSLLALHERSAGVFDLNSQPMIPVEKIRAPILLLSGGDDKLWQATSFCQIIKDRLDAYGRSHMYTHIDYKKAGHLMFFPFQPTTTTHFGPFILGGTKETNAAAAQHAWQQSVRFLKRTAL